ncbi:MAG TPA: GtrA family protein [Acidimicrobiales bacterium]|nr:GtrA family protein [Acidimicrobiales bacterium]
MLRREQVRYLLIGGYNTAFGYLFFAALVVLFADRIHYTVLLLVSHVVSTLNAYVGYRLFVFRVRGSFFRDLFRFWSVYAVQIAVNLVVLPVFVRVSGLGVLPSQGIIVAVTTVATYLAHKHFSFRRPAASPEAGSDKNTLDPP